MSTTSHGARVDASGAGRGDLRTALLDHAVALTRERGPEAVSLREVQRRAGVSPAAAYRHYRSREALLVVVGQRASALLADAIAEALAGVPVGPDARGTACARLRAGSAAYITFVGREPGLFRAVFLTDERPEQLDDPAAASRGATGLGPYQLLRGAIQDVVDVGVLPETDAPWSDTTVWAACHGLAVLFLDGPLRHLDDAARSAATDRLLDVVMAGLAAR